MIGHPKFKEDEKVTFSISFQDNGEKITKTGIIYIVDAYGVFEDNSDVYYDIMVEEDNCLYKHIKETGVSKVE